MTVFIDLKSRMWMEYCPVAEWSKEWVDIGNNPYNSSETLDDFEKWCYKNKPVQSTLDVNYIFENKDLFTEKELINRLIRAIEKAKNGN